MPEFRYEGINKEGIKSSGNIHAESEGELRMILRSNGIRPKKITVVNALQKDLFSFFNQFFDSVPLIVLISFTRMLQVLISSGIPLVQGLQILSDQTPQKSFKKTLDIIREKISQGSYLWQVLSTYPKIFSKLYVALIRAGEASGSLEQILKRLSHYLEDTERLRRLIKGAMSYPIILIAIGGGVVFGLTLFVIPKFESMLKNSGKALPLPTQIVINTSHFMIDHIATIIGSLFLLFYLIKRYIQSEEGKILFDRFLFHLPLFGVMIQKSSIAKFARTLQTLLFAGVNLIDAIEICRSTIDNSVLNTAVGKMKGEIESGKTLGVVMEKLKIFPSMAIQMISIGESTGNLDKMLEKVADFYEEEVENLVASMSKLIEPLVLVFLGGSIGGIMIAMYLPIFQMAGGAE